MNPPNEPVISREEAFAQLTAPGETYELTEANIDGQMLPVFANGPNSLRELFEATKDSQAEFMVYDDERYTYAETYQLVALAGHRLIQNFGIQAGDRVAISMRNYPEWVISFMAATSIGAIAVPLNAWWQADEMVYGLEDCGAKVLIMDQERVDRIAPHLPELGVTSIAVRCKDPLPEGVQHWQDWLACDDREALMTQGFPAATIEPDQNATILYTSGSTSHPKGVLATHRSIISAVLSWEFSLSGARLMFPDMFPDDGTQPAILLIVPLFHVTGSNVHFLSSFRAERKMVMMYKWEPGKALPLIEQERITTFNGVPTMSWELLQHPDFEKYDLSSLRSVGGGGAPMAPEHARKVSEKITSGQPGTGYGMTETNGLGTSISGAVFLERPSSCGAPIPPLVEIQIADDDGNPLAAGETGQICFRGAMNMRGYWKKPEATAETIKNGWLYSGDIGHKDEEGFLFITDRAKDMIIRGGENIGCAEVEACLYEHPDVSECSVFGLPDERLGEVVSTAVYLKLGHDASADDLRAHVSEHLAKFKAPTHVFFRNEQLPRTASGKIYKKELRAEYLEQLQHG
ncbi:MAG: AMP-binding protein [Pseudomonadota bacterium]